MVTENDQIEIYINIYWYGGLLTENTDDRRKEHDKEFQKNG